MRLSLHLFTTFALLPLTNAGCPFGSRGGGLCGKAAASKAASKSSDDTGLNPNGVPYGTPDPKIKCAFFRVVNPRTDSYVNFREDVEKGGLDPGMADASSWPFIYVQQGAQKAFEEGAGLDTQDLDGYVEGVMSHTDLMWPHRSEIGAFLKGKEVDGTVSVVDLYEAKKFTANNFYDMDVTFGSYMECPLVFLKCGGDAETGRVLLKSVLEFFDGKEPSNGGGRITPVDFQKVTGSLMGAVVPPPAKSTDEKDFAMREEAVKLVGTKEWNKKVLGL